MRGFDPICISLWRTRFFLFSRLDAQRSVTILVLFLCPDPENFSNVSRWRRRKKEREINKSRFEMLDNEGGRIKFDHHSMGRGGGTHTRTGKHQFGWD